MNVQGSRRLTIVCVALSAWLWGPTSWGLTPGQIDDFEDGTVANWAEGGGSPNPPTNVADGGPTGAGDAYLENISSGSGGPGGRLAMFNRTQWSCDYNAAGSEITLAAEMANFGATPLAMRVGVERSSGDLTRFVSTAAVALPADGVWRTVTFVLRNSDMTNALGGQTLAEVLDDVGELRVISAATAVWQADEVAATLGVDNFRVESLPVELESFAIE